MTSSQPPTPPEPAVSQPFRLMNETSLAHKIAVALYESGGRDNKNGDPVISVYWDGCSSRGRDVDALKIIIRRVLEPALATQAERHAAEVALLTEKLEACQMALANSRIQSSENAAVYGAVSKELDQLRAEAAALKERLKNEQH